MIVLQPTCEECGHKPNGEKKGKDWVVTSTTCPKCGGFVWVQPVGKLVKPRGKLP